MKTPAGQKFYIGDRVRLLNDRSYYKAGELLEIDGSYAQLLREHDPDQKNVRDYSVTTVSDGRRWSWVHESEIERRLSDLQPGYYWVKITLDGKEQQYIGHNWGDGDWDVFGMDYKYGPDDFSEIGPRITPPAN